MSLSPDDVVARFKDSGGQFLLADQDFVARARGLEALVFDWDGVFNAGIKDSERGSPFGEADSMGLNLLRFAMRRDLPRVPPTAIITGEKNLTALSFASRERLHCAYRGIGHKATAFADFCGRFGLSPDKVALIFDDANDLSMAELGGLRLLIKRKAGLLFEDYARRKGLCDYVTFSEGGQNAVREVCELIMGLRGRLDDTLEERTNRSPAYEGYFSERQAIVPVFLTEQDGKIASLLPTES